MRWYRALIEQLNRIERHIFRVWTVAVAVDARLARLEPAGAEFGADVLRRLDRIETRLKARDEGPAVITWTLGPVREQ